MKEKIKLYEVVKPIIGEITVINIDYKPLPMSGINSIKDMYIKSHKQTKP